VFSYQPGRWVGVSGCGDGAGSGPDQPDARDGREAAGAALDVFDVEPLPLSGPLRFLPNVVLTPHLGYVTDDAYRVLYGEAVEDIVAFAQGSPVRVL